MGATTKKVLIVVGVLSLLLCSIIAVKTATYPSRQMKVEPAPVVEVSSFAAARRLSESIRLRTISFQDRKRVDLSAFHELHAMLERAYPKTHQALRREKLAELSLLYTWQGKDKSLKPILLLAHQDVVPVAPGTERNWRQAPFSGAIKDGYVWGRGSLDDKLSVLGWLEAVEMLLTSGFQPKRTVLLAFGHDEEIGGRGAKAIARELRRRKIRPWFVLDEGSLIADGIIPALGRPGALFGIAEKGYATLRIIARGGGGHSSMPPPHTAAGVLAKAIARLEAHPMPASLAGVVEQQFDYLGPEMGMGMRLPLANRWLFRGLIRSKMEKLTSANAQLRTTMAVTMLQGSPKENVLPETATATINFRIKPGQTLRGVESYVKAVVGKSIEVEVLPGASEPTPVSPIDSDSFRLMQKSVQQVFPRAVFAPALVIATTDARHYVGLSPNVYRFLPVPFEKADLKRLHGTNERIKIEDYTNLIRFYRQVLLNASG